MASDARVRSAAILARSQIFTPDAILPVVLPLNIRGRTVQNVIAVYLRCGLRCRPCIFRSKSGCRVGTVQLGAGCLGHSHVQTDLY
ncbi:DUF1472 domain-containing protein (plasmid) [Enterobacter hormaechei]|uniref:DUF1472 domain-containing protein n=1 Tax=Enterobacter hormaechei TaxID=158836 RepID=A0A2J0PS77_9ENTR|nr:hypothetical protein AM429_23610 [Enterobacter cloacae complex sp.]AVU22986.1 DUF1472 domain-containing protein [Enterobacter cloacae]AXO43083.1 DUF1472 domain-containing protein [Enterobacter hormaechei]QEL38687.1 DUF1472 domain-containing protein [Enterobacter chengduensis]QIU92530.1 DUF1472 domain-containing protein [Yokenella regensburgei]RYA47547.1 DUF1472 domain-containing protein [Enterobacter cloacae complex sp. 677-3DZ2D5B]RYA69222.1 DUF1472 domain-containing protein [Enterobacter